MTNIKHIKNSFKARLWKLGLTAKDIDVDDFVIQTLEDYRTTLIKEIEEAKEEIKNRYRGGDGDCSNDWYEGKEAGLDKASEIIRGDKN